jgi:hypothetical protein
MSIKRLLKGKGSFVTVIWSLLSLNDVINQLDIDKVGALVVTGACSGWSKWRVRLFLF